MRADPEVRPMWIPFAIFLVLWFLSIDLYMPVVVSFAFLTAALLVLTAWLMPPSQHRS
jgi:hypothetical protein